MNGDRMMWWISVAIVIMAIIVARRWWSSEELREFPCSTLLSKNICYKLLDIRDAVDFEEGHVPGAVNISLGRLPYVSNKELTTEHSIIILGKKDRNSKKAARILKKNGFNHIYVCMNG
jgi:rhodanese-related sulfurtransferase